MQMPVGEINQNPGFLKVFSQIAPVLVRKSEVFANIFNEKPGFFRGFINGI